MNTLSRCVLELNSEYARRITESDLSAFSATEIELLTKRGFLVDDEVDEIAVLRRSYQLAKDSNECFDVVIALTTACNFSCRYCFENDNVNQVMSPETESLLCDAITRQLEKCGCKKLKVSWYGGEPLLQTERMLNMARRLNALAERFGTTIEQGVVTNGYLLVPSVVQSLIDVGISHAQVTIDGPPATHNRRRPLKDGSGTYDTIMENLAAIVNEIPEDKFDIALRFNADKENSGQYSDLSKMIDNLGSKSIRLYPALVEIVDEKPGYSSSCFSDEEFGDFCFAVHQHDSFEETIQGLLEPKSCFCTAEKSKSLVVAPDGSCFNCWNDITNPSRALFHLSDPEKLNPIAVGRFLGRDPFTQEPCSTCAYIPICSGGCAYERWITGSPRCVPERFEIERLIKEYVIPEK